MKQKVFAIFAILIAAVVVISLSTGIIFNSKNSQKTEAKNRLIAELRSGGVNDSNWREVELYKWKFKIPAVWHYYKPPTSTSFHLGDDIASDVSNQPIMDDLPGLFHISEQTDLELLDKNAIQTKILVAGHEAIVYEVDVCDKSILSTPDDECVNRKVRHIFIPSQNTAINWNASMVPQKIVNQILSSFKFID